MHVLMVMYPHPEDPARFRAYYEGTHVPLAAKLPGLLHQSHGYPSALGPTQPPYFCIWKGAFASARELELALTSAAGKAVADDVPNYSPGGATLLHFDEL